MTGRHRPPAPPVKAGRHRKPAVPRKPVQLPRPVRRYGLRVVCCCGFCAAVIPLFAQNAPDPASPPNLISAPSAPVVLQPTPPVITIQPRVDTVDMLTAVNSEMAHGGDHGGSHDGGDHDKSGGHESHDSSSHDHSSHEEKSSDSAPSDHGHDGPAHDNPTPSCN